MSAGDERGPTELRSKPRESADDEVQVAALFVDDDGVGRWIRTYWVEGTGLSVAVVSDDDVADWEPLRLVADL